MNTLFNTLGNYEKYLKDNPFHLDLGIDLSDYGKADKKKIHPVYRSVDKENKIPSAPELDDLIRLHFLVRSRKVTTIMEMGVGKSTIVFDNALQQNKIDFSDYVTQNLRRSNPFECHSIDNNSEWIDITKKSYNFSNVIFHHSECINSTFNSRVCTFYDPLPNICPDFIYLDAPDLYSPTGDVRGVSTNHPDRLPMSADILSIEHFLLPGTLIVLDGRTANARFLECNLQRNWSYFHSMEFDQHYFELNEEPLGIYNKRQLDFINS